MIDSFTSITNQATETLKGRISSEWFNADGTPKPNYIWKISDPTKKGDGGEEIVGQVFETIYKELYPNYEVIVNVVGADKGDFDVIVTITDLDLVIKIEVKTATQDTNKNFQFNGLKKHIDYDYAFGVGVTPDDFLFSIVTREHLEETLTTNMNRDVIGSYKWSQRASTCRKLTPSNLLSRMNELGLIRGDVAKVSL